MAGSALSQEDPTERLRAKATLGLLTESSVGTGLMSGGEVGSSPSPRISTSFVWNTKGELQQYYHNTRMVIYRLNISSKM